MASMTTRGRSPTAAGGRFTSVTFPHPTPSSLVRNQRTPMAPTLKEPYDQYHSLDLRTECTRRMLAVRRKGPTRNCTREGFIELLRESDMIARAIKESAENIGNVVTKATAAPAATATSTTSRPMTVLVDMTKKKPQVHMMKSPTPTLLKSARIAEAAPAPDQAAPSASVQLTAPAPVPTKAQAPVATRVTRSPKMDAPTTRAARSPTAGSTAAPTHASPSRLTAATTARTYRATSRTSGTVRAKRGCRFRLINVLLSPEFKARWAEMPSTVKPRLHENPEFHQKAPVSQFWLDVHLAFMSINDFYDKLHFQDPLFVNINADVIQAHTAAKLYQMWNEVTTMYRRAAKSAIQRAKDNPNTISFFDSCSGRLDLLYLHLGLLSESSLMQFVLNNNATPEATPSVSPSASSVSLHAPPKQKVGRPKKAAIDTGKPATPLIVAAPPPENPPAVPVTAKAAAATINPPMTRQKTASPAVAAKKISPRVVKPNPNTVAQPPQQPATAPRSAALPVRSNAEAKDPVVAVNQAVPYRVPNDSVPHTSRTNSLSGDSGSSDYEATEEIHTKAMTPSNKRRREVTSTDIVEVPSRNEMVSRHPKRIHTTAVTTTMSSELMAPQDEWDVIERRLRKINECVDRCHRQLSGLEGILDDVHRQNVESDLRFYSAIKQRLQEQFLMTMHDGF